MKQDQSLDAYLLESKYIDYLDPQMQAIIKTITEKERSEIDRIKAAFEYVRDKIDHSYDIKNNEVTRKASEVLEKKHGICYAKSHLLAALLRGMGIPSGICYQRLTLFDKPEDGFCIHALNTVYVREFDKWIRLDARGNKKGIDAQFSVNEEKLAFPIREQYGEVDYVENYHEPRLEIIKTLEKHSDSYEMYNSLPTELDT